MLKKIAVILLFFTFSFSLFAQIGGESTYNFLKINSSPRSAAMAGATLIPMYNSVSMISQNPALLDSGMHKNISATYQSYLAGISHSSIAGAWHNDYVGNFGVSLVSLNYGSFDKIDEYDEDYGKFNANEFAIGLHYSRRIMPYLSFGMSLNTIISQLERYHSYGMALNVGARFHSADGLFNATLAFKNAGAQFKPYTDDNRESLPFEIQLSIAQKLEGAPFGWSITLNDLQSFNVYNNTKNQTTSLDGSEKKEGTITKIGKEFLSHLSLGVQVIPSKYFFVMGGYNYRRSNELKIEERGGGVGFSFGLGIRLKRFELDYAHSIYHVGGSTNNFGVTIKL